MPTQDQRREALRRAGCVFPHDELRALSDASPDEATLDRMVVRRVTGEPVEHIVGHTDFAGIRLVVRPGVFIPRFRTELLARLTCRELRSGDRLLDYACGAGTVAAFAMSRITGLDVVAADADPQAVACARLNLRDAHVLVASSLRQVPPPLFDVVAANLPYVPTAEIEMLPHEARDHENLLALDGGTDGLDPLRGIAADLPTQLRRGGRFLIEVSRAQARTAVGILSAVGLRTAGVHRDRALEATVVIAQGA